MFTKNKWWKGLLSFYFFFILTCMISPDNVKLTCIKNKVVQILVPGQPI